ncbi:Rha family transcriptional regulator [Vibrio sp. S234-5]|uniref:Rha family transcriptional regulator n=1 Tax=Vibrio sp. S234-5 TaxID=1616781 RepID=UPI000695A915|nr:Rha family transcriptional regulator [Vibrio sp. S234-5]
MTTLISPIASAKTSDLVFVSQTNELVTDSFHVAKYFGKLHKNVLQKLQQLECSPEFTKLNFQLCHKNNELQNGKLQPFYQMTKDGFMFLVMGFTGKRAAEIKERYINAFNEMEQKLANNQKKLPEPQTPVPSMTRVMLVIENGQTVEAKHIPNDAFVVSKSRIANLIAEPGIFTMQEMAQISEAVNKQIVEIAVSASRSIAKH